MLGVGNAGARGEWRAAAVEPVAGIASGCEPDTSPSPWPPSSAASRSRSATAMPAAGALSLDEVDAWAVLVAVDGIGPVTLAALLGALGSGRAVLSTAAGPAGPRRLAEAVSARGGRLDARLWRSIADAAQQAPALIARVRALGIEVLTIESADYPGRLDRKSVV